MATDRDYCRSLVNTAMGFLFKKPTRRTNYPNLFCYKTLHVSGIFSAHHQEFSTVHSSLVSFMQVSDDRLEAVLGASRPAGVAAATVFLRCNYCW